MCVEKVPAWSHGDKLYRTEEDALKAALKDIADSLMKEHSARLDVGLLAMSGKLRTVLERLDAIEEAKPKAEPAAIVVDAMAEAA
jgi:hypothetical protein